MDKSAFLNSGKGFLIGMVHCLPLPGTMGFKGDMRKIIDQAVNDAKTLEKAGMDAIIVENMGDAPFGVKLDTAQISALAAISALVAEQVNLPIGIDAAMNDYEAAISIAKAIGGAFVRIPVFVDTVEFYGGIIKPCAREAMLYRKSLGAEDIKILADIQVKHTHMVLTHMGMLNLDISKNFNIQVKHTHMVLTHVSVEDSAKAAADCGADAIIVTGTHIGVETPIEIIKRVKAVTKLPVIAGSGVKTSNVKEQLAIADGAIVGSSLKEGGKIENPVSYELCRELICALRG